MSCCTFGWLDFCRFSLLLVYLLKSVPFWVFPDCSKKDLGSLAGSPGSAAYTKVCLLMLECTGG